MGGGKRMLRLDRYIRNLLSFSSDIDSYIPYCATYTGGTKILRAQYLRYKGKKGKFPFLIPLAPKRMDTRLRLRTTLDANE